MNTQNSGTARSAKIGLLAIMVVWMTGPLTVPIVKILKHQFSAEEILVVRSIFGIALSWFIVGNKIWKTDRHIKIAGFIIGMSSIAFYRGIQAWDVNPMMMLLTLCPVVNMIIALGSGRKVSPVVFASLALIILGIVRMLNLSEQGFKAYGFVMGLACTVLGGVGFDMWGRAKSHITIHEMCFWLSFPITCMSIVIVVFNQLPINASKYSDPRSLLLLLAIGVVNGIVYIYCTIVPFTTIGKMNTVVASVLLQGTTPCTMVGAYYLVGERLTPSQWIGVGIALAGATILSGWLALKPKTDSQAA